MNPAELNSERIPLGLPRGKRANKNKTLPCNEDFPRFTAESLQLLKDRLTKIYGEQSADVALEKILPRGDVQALADHAFPAAAAFR